VLKTRVQRWGNSLAVRIPKSFAEQAGLEASTPIDLSVVDGKLTIQPVSEHTFSLEELLAGVTEENRHAEVETGLAVGNEAW
jgi:antitoxin MazE